MNKEWDFGVEGFWGGGILAGGILVEGFWRRDLVTESSQKCAKQYLICRYLITIYTLHRNCFWDSTILFILEFPKVCNAIPNM